MPFKCCVLGCKYEGNNGLHSFPSDQTVAAKWIELSQVKKKDTLADRSKNKTLSHSYYLICKNHFKPSDYDSNGNNDHRLKKGVVPSLCLPDVLLSIEREHDYSPIPKKRTKRQDALFNSNGSSIESGNYIVDNSSEITLADFWNFTDVGASTDVVSNDNPDFPGQKKSEQEKSEKVHEPKVAVEPTTKAVEWTDDNVVKYLSNKFNKQQLEVFKMQIYNSDKKVNGRRYTDDQKSLCLSMYKQSPKKYRFLRRFLILPGKSTLARHRAHLTFESGIDSKLMELMKLKVKDMSEQDKISVIGWDETALKPHIDYDKSRDIIDGFVDIDGLRRPEFATHALTFMVRGIQTPFKEPVSFHYTSNLLAVELSGLVRGTIEAVSKTGLNLIGSVCDQPSTCTAAVYDLIKPGSEGVTPNGDMLMYTVAGNNLIHFFDVPHIWKVLRNNLIVKDLCHTLTKKWEITDCKVVGGLKKYASWDHIVQLYELDQKAAFRFVKKLTPEHIHPNREKMKVSNATQIFSRTVGTEMLKCSEKKQLTEDAADTALVLLFFNDLFDSLNGGGVPCSESLKGSIDNQSVHFAYWEYALSVLKNMNFVDKTTKAINNRSSVLKKLESTIKGYMEVTRICLNENVPEVAIRMSETTESCFLLLGTCVMLSAELAYLLKKNTNQDGLENFFGCCKGLCGAKPIASHFRSAYTTMIMNNLSGPVSKGSNCEEDRFFALLSNINTMLLDFDDCVEGINETGQNGLLQIDIEKENEQNMLDTIVFDPLFGETGLNFVETESISNSCTTVFRKLMESFPCDDCQSTLQESSSDFSCGDIIFPSQIFRKHFEKVFLAINTAIPHFCHEKSVRKKIVAQIGAVQEFPIGCKEHCTEMALKLKELTATYSLSSFCYMINNTLSGKVIELPPGCDHMQTKAFQFRQKKSHIGKHSDKFID